MAWRRQSDEIAFGSDSFLDILANIVGILIILIVIAGVRVIQSPVVSPESVPPASVDIGLASAPEPHPRWQDVQVAIPLPPLNCPLQAPEDPEPIEQPPLPEPPPLSPDLIAQVDGIEHELEALNQRRVTLAAEQQGLTARQYSLERQLSEAQQTADVMRQELAHGRNTASSEEERLESMLRNLAALQVTLAEVNVEQPPPTVLKHKLTPVGRKVEGAEVHFLLSGGRVAVVPIDELGKELQSHLERKRDQILRTQRYVGSIGPVQGFRMNYVLERLPTSIIEELRAGAVIMRSGVTEFQFLPQPGVIWESAAQAIHAHGRFVAALRGAGPEAALTYWVYPDSFSLHRELLEFAHEQGYEVAARPLPDGVPISGSPQGSRSVAQ